MIQRSEMNAQRAQTLKDIGDVSSASKVKCDKQRPVCSHCNRLGYPSFYSLARRKGRPHPHRNQGTQRGSVKSGEQPLEEQRDSAEGGAIPSQTGLPKSVGPDHDTGANAQGPHNTNYQQDPDPSLHYQQGTLARTNPSHLSSYSNVEACLSINPRQLNGHVLPAHKRHNL